MRNSLRAIRRAKNLTQQKLGELSGYDHRTIAGYEKSEKRLPPEFLKKMSQALGVSADQIQSGDSELLILNEEAPLSHEPLLKDMPLNALKQLGKHLAEEMTTAQGEQYQKILNLLNRVTTELNARVVGEAKADAVARAASEKRK